jgi:hypothetical protein
MTSSTTATFTATITVVNRADCLTPSTSSAVTASTSAAAGRLTPQCWSVPPPIEVGKWMPSGYPISRTAIVIDRFRPMCY